MLADGTHVDQRRRQAHGGFAELVVARRVAQSCRNHKWKLRLHEQGNGKYSAMVVTHGVQVVEDVVHAYDLIVEVVVAVGRRQERVPEGDEQVEDVDGLGGQGEQVELACQGGVAAVQELEQGDEGGPQFPPRAQTQPQPATLLVAQHSHHHPERQLVQLVREFLHQVTQHELDN